MGASQSPTKKQSTGVSASIKTTDVGIHFFQDKQFTIPILMRLWVTLLILRATVLSADAACTCCGAPPVPEIKVWFADYPRAFVQKSRQIP